MSPGADSTHPRGSSTYCRPVSLGPRALPAGFIGPCLSSLVAGPMGRTVMGAAQRDHEFVARLAAKCTSCTNRRS
jgi:hypothetical protein